MPPRARRFLRRSTISLRMRALSDQVAELPQQIGATVLIDGDMVHVGEVTPASLRQ